MGFISHKSDLMLYASGLSLVLAMWLESLTVMPFAYKDSIALSIIPNFVDSLRLTSGLTHGVVEVQTVGNSKIPYKAEGFNATVYFKGFWMVCGEDNKPFALAGDSGSLVVTEDGSAAVGLVFAYGTGCGCILPIKAVLDKLGGAQIVTRYRIPNVSG